MKAVLVDNLTRLEERVEGLIGNLDKAIRDNAELRQYNAELEAEVEQIQEKNAALLERVKKAHQEVEEAVGREGVVRDRLQAILERIDTIEDQIHQPQTVE